MSCYGAKKILEFNYKLVKYVITVRTIWKLK